MHCFRGHEDSSNSWEDRKTESQFKLLGGQEDGSNSWEDTKTVQTLGKTESRVIFWRTRRHEDGSNSWEDMNFWEGRKTRCEEMS